MDVVRMFDPGLNDQKLPCLPRLCSCFSVFLHLFSSSSVQLAVLTLSPEATAPPHLLWAYLLQLCVKEAFIGHQRGCWGFAVNGELLHGDAVWFACSKALFDCFWTGGCVWDKGMVALPYLGTD